MTNTNPFWKHLVKTITRFKYMTTILFTTIIDITLCNSTLCVNLLMECIDTILQWILFIMVRPYHIIMWHILNIHNNI